MPGTPWPQVPSEPRPCPRELIGRDDIIYIQGGNLGVAPSQYQDTNWDGCEDACNEGEGWGRGWNRPARLPPPALGSLDPTVILTLIQTLSLITASPNTRLTPS